MSISRTPNRKNYKAENESEIFARASELTRQRKHQEAINEFQKIKKYRVVDAKIRIARCYLNLENFPQSLKTLDGVQRDTITHLQRDKLFLNYAKYYAAVFAVYKSKTDLFNFRNYLEKIADQSDLTVQSEWANYYLKEENYERALETIHKIKMSINDSAQNPSLSPTISFVKVHVQNMEILIHERLNNIKGMDKSIKELAETISNSEDEISKFNALNIIAHRSLGPDYLNMGQITKPSDNNQENWLEYAMVLVKTGKISEAEEAYLAILEKFPTLWQARLNYAYMLQHDCGDPQSLKNSIPILKHMLASTMTPAPTDDQRVKAYTSLAIAHLKLNQVNDALVCIGKGLAINPNHAPLLSVKAKASGRNVQKRNKAYEQARASDEGRFSRLHPKAMDLQHETKVMSLDENEFPQLGLMTQDQPKKKEDKSFGGKKGPWQAKPTRLSISDDIEQVAKPENLSTPIAEHAVPQRIGPIEVETLSKTKTSSTTTTTTTTTTASLQERMMAVINKPEESQPVLADEMVTEAIVVGNQQKIVPVAAKVPPLAADVYGTTAIVAVPEERPSLFRSSYCNRLTLFSTATAAIVVTAAAVGSMWSKTWSPS